MSELESDVKVDMPMQDQQLEITAGNMLREAREARGLAVLELAASLKVSVKKIEAIEGGRFDLLPDMVFARALAFSICRNLKVDATPILEQFPPTLVPNLKNDESGINTPFRASQDVSRFRVLNIVFRPVAIVLFLLTLVALGLYVFPLFDTSKLEGIAAVSISKITYPPQLQDKSISQSVASLEPTSVEAAVLAPSYPIVNNGLAMSGWAGTPGNIVFKSHGTSWVEVVDAKGTVQLRRTLIIGEVAGASGVLPLTVVVGKADSLDVSVAGKPFSLIDVAKDNVARFEVKE